MSKIDKSLVKISGCLNLGMGCRSGWGGEEWEETANTHSGLGEVIKMFSY